MIQITLLLFLAQAPAQSVTKAPTPAQLPPEVVQSILKAAERVAAIAQSGVLCQAVVTTELGRASAFNKDRLETENKISGFEKDIVLQRNVQARTKVATPEYKTALVAIDHARELIANAKKYLTGVTADERESAQRLRKQEACVAAAQTQLEEIRNPKRPG